MRPLQLLEKYLPWWMMTEIGGLGPVRQSVDLAWRLSAVGVPATLIEVQGVGHGFAVPGERPAPERLIVVEFFVSALG